MVRIWGEKRSEYSTLGYCPNKDKVSNDLKNCEQIMIPLGEEQEVSLER